jgi:putative transposase
MDGAERWRILRLHVEDEIPLAELARDTKVSLRTLERWHRLFQEGGIAALDPRPRVPASMPARAARQRRPWRSSSGSL